MRLLLVSVFTVLCVASPALAEVTACDLVRTADVEALVGRLDKIEGGRREICAGSCDSLHNSACTFSSTYRPSAPEITVEVSFPPFITANATMREYFRGEVEASGKPPVGGHAFYVEDLGDLAVWTFDSGSSGYLEVEVAEKYYVYVQVRKMRDEALALKDAEILARLTLQRLREHPVADLRGD